MKGHLLFTLVLSFVLLQSLWAEAAFRVIDADTISDGRITYRLNGIDAPEMGQACSSQAGKKWKCGEAATSYLAAKLKNASVRCEGSSQDRYGRTIATCFADGEDIGESLVASGLAWSFRRYSMVYVQTEETARAAKLGIWAGNNMPPWEFRAAKWAVAEQKAPDGCPIKGNISKNGKIYHAPWSPWYGRTKVSPSKGERWFCNEAEALAAGWRAPAWQ